VVKNAAEMARALQGYGFRLVSGGTDNHLRLVDLRPKSITGKAAERVLGHAGITSNKNAIPFDPEKPAVTSGLRLGTAAVTSRGMKENEMREIARAIDEVLSKPEDEPAIRSVRARMADLSSSFPLYKSIKK
jgi:glycine hydroxymethyltransferase